MAEAWQEDLEFLVQNMQNIHPNLFFYFSENEFDQAVDLLKQKLPILTDNQIIVEFAKLISLPKDGHTLLFPLQKNTGFQIYPLRLYYFDDGLFVVDALPPHQDLIGSKVLSVGNKDVEDIYQLLAATISHDNANTIKLIAPKPLPEVNFL